MTPILSILIPSIPERAYLFNPLYDELNRQVAYMHDTHPTLGKIEILVDNSDSFLRGGMSIGQKRDSLVQRATGRYLCFLDDDDAVSGDYLETLVRMAQYKACILTFNAFCKLETYWMVVEMSLKNEINEEARPGIIQRRPWHVCPVISTYAKQHKFENVSYGEDWKWFEKVLNHCYAECTTDAILYEYRHGAHSESDKIIKAGYV